MKRKIVSTFLLLLIVFTMGSQSFANGNSKYQVNTPEKTSISTTNNTILISGKAPKGTDIIIDVYGAVDYKSANFKGSKNYSLSNLPEKEDYVLISKQNIISGPAGFGEEIGLIKGINKIIITFKVDGVDAVERIIYHYDANELKKI